MKPKITRTELHEKVRQLESALHIEDTLQNLTSSTHDFYRTLFEHMLYEVHVWQLVRGKNGEIETWTLIDANPSALVNWGRKLEDVIGLCTDDIFPGVAATETFMPIVEKIFLEKKPYVWEHYFPGTGQILHMISIPMGDAFISCGIDVTDIKQVESKIVTTQRRLAIATEVARVGVWEYNLESQSIVWDDSMFRIYGLSPSESALPYQTWASSVHEDDIVRATHDLERAIAKKGEFNSEFRIVRRDNAQVRYILARAAFYHGKEGESDRLIGANIDITERKESEQQIEKLAYFDVLTGLPNRSMINEQLSESIELGGRTHKHNALIFVDLDNFKHVNDTAGHAVGDELLVTLASRIKNVIRRGDTFGRFGGDEFVIILNNLSEHETLAARSAKAFSLKIIQLLKEPMELSTGFYSITASLGITLFRENAEPSDVLRQADLAMYKAKWAGRNTTHFFDPEMQKHIVERVELERDLVVGIRNNNFEVFYQTQVDEFGGMKGAEALLRWNHPTKGYISPATFIPVAEDSGLIREIGRWVFRQVCDDLKTKIGKLVDDTFVISINVSAIQLYDDDFLDLIRHDIEASEISASKIKFELTESALFKDSDLSLQVMLKLKELNFQLSLDDFGTGYSSLSRLKELPIDELKIDRSFVQDILTNSDSAAIARSIIALADSLGLEVIAEGVESAAQMEKLRKKGCRAYQGFLFSQALPLDQFLAFIEAR